MGRKIALYAIECAPAFLFIQLCLAFNVSWPWFFALSAAWIISGAAADTAKDYRKELK